MFVCLYKLTLFIATHEQEEETSVLLQKQQQQGEKEEEIYSMEITDQKVHHVNDEQSNVVVPETAHAISQDTWLQAGFVLTTGLNSAYALGYSGTIMVSLGWIGGVVGLFLAAAISLYANFLIAELHETGGKRHIRYRDLAGHIYGRKAYSLTWGLQYVNLFMINTGYIILAGQSLKAVNVLYTDSHALKLPHFIAISGLVCALFACAVPHLSALRVWLGVSAVLSLTYIVPTCVLSFRDGLKTPNKDYSIPGTEVTKIFTTIGAAANLVFAYNTGMLPEMQATVKQPVVENMKKGLYFQFTIGALPMYAVIFIGYWAYGSTTSSYLLNSVAGPVWMKTMANLAAFLQTVIALHIFASPMYEYLDTKYGKIKGSPFSLHNLSFRVGVRASYLALNTLVAALLPFLGDFMMLTGAFSTFPLTFILANHMYLTVKKSKLTSLQSWHWLNVVVFSVMAFATAGAALRLIAEDKDLPFLRRSVKKGYPEGVYQPAGSSLKSFSGQEGFISCCAKICMKNHFFRTYYEGISQVL